MSVILLLLAVASVDFREGIRNEQLRTASQTLVEDFKRMENLALSGQEFDFGEDVVEVPAAYGVFIDTQLVNGYAMYADKDDNLYFGSQDDEIVGNGPVQFPDDVSITKVSIAGTKIEAKLSVAYELPKPTMHFIVQPQGEDPTENPGAELTIILSHAKTENCRTVKLNRITGRASEAPSPCPSL